MAVEQAKLSSIDVPSGAIILFVLITFATTWGIIGSSDAFPDSMEATFGTISGAHPLYFAATWAPAIAGIAVVLIYGGVHADVPPEGAGGAVCAGF